MAHNYPTDSDDVLRNAKILGFFEGRRLVDTAVKKYFYKISKIILILYSLKVRFKIQVFINFKIG